jgi:hypothetical protein
MFYHEREYRCYRNLVTLFATDAALAWRSKKSTTTRQPIKVDSNFTCEYDAEGYFAGIFYLWNIHLNIKLIDFRSKILSYLSFLYYRCTSSSTMFE